MLARQIGYTVEISLEGDTVTLRAKPREKAADLTPEPAEVDAAATGL